MPLYDQIFHPCSKWRLQWLPSAKDDVHVFIYTKSKTMRNVFIYKNPHTFQKARQFPFGFIYKKPDTLCYAIFIKFKLGNYIQKAWHFVLREVFIYKKPDNFQKARPFPLHCYIQRFGHFALRNFLLNLWNWMRVGDFLNAKKECTLCYIFICKKNSLCVMFYIKKSLTLWATFLYTKKIHFV